MRGRGGERRRDRECREGGGRGRVVEWIVGGEELWEEEERLRGRTDVKRSIDV